MATVVRGSPGGGNRASQATSAIREAVGSQSRQRSPPTTQPQVLDPHITNRVTRSWTPGRDQRGIPICLIDSIDRCQARSNKARALQGGCVDGDTSSSASSWCANSDTVALLCRSYRFAASPHAREPSPSVFIGSPINALQAPAGHLWCVHMKGSRRYRHM